MEPTVPTEQTDEEEKEEPAKSTKRKSKQNQSKRKKSKKKVLPWPAIPAHIKPHTKMYKFMKQDLVWESDRWDMDDLIHKLWKKRKDEKVVKRWYNANARVPTKK